MSGDSLWRQNAALPQQVRIKMTEEQADGTRMRLSAPNIHYDMSQVAYLRAFNLLRDYVMNTYTEKSK